MKKIGIVFAALVIVTFMVGTAALMMPAMAQPPSYKTNVKWTFSNVYVPSPCTDDYYVVLNGDLHWLEHVRLDSNDGFHSKCHINLAGVSGTGYPSGDKYQATGVAQCNYNSKVGETETCVLNINLISQGQADNLLMRGRMHYTVNAIGETTVDFGDFTIICK